MPINYLQDYIIIDWLCALDDLFEKYKMVTLNPYSAYALGYYSYFYNEEPEKLDKQFNSLHSLEIVNSDEVDKSSSKVNIDIIVDPVLELQKLI
mmetsp:Transcript_3800/g.3246  ORF Transcript_3800/g.3246 Transcript_3800/m.3246 type:complete len:94 (+) Transcript_3800:37-318(+)